MHLGEKKRMALPADSTAHLGNKNILSVRQAQNSVILRAMARGETYLTLGDQNFQVFVLSKEEKVKTLLVDRFLKDVWGLEWHRGKELEISGSLYSFEDWLALADLSRRHSVTYRFKAALQEGLKEEADRFFKALFKKHRLAFPAYSLGSSPAGGCS